MNPTMQHVLRMWLILNLAWCGWAAPCVADGARQLGSLPPSQSPRRELTERVWPAEVHKPHVCLWKDDV